MIQMLIRSIRQQAQSWFTQAQVADTDENWVVLPEHLYAQLAQRVRERPYPDAYKAEIQSAIATAIQTWQENLGAANALVFLANPVEPIGTILGDSLQDWAESPMRAIYPLACDSRPSDPLTLPQHLQQTLQRYPQINTNPEKFHTQTDVTALENRKTLVVIPGLEQCFLRCIGGWESIEYLRDIILHNRHCFWVIGCNHWAWDFLDFACQINAYFSEVKTLPDFDEEMLKDWLSPLSDLLTETQDSETTEAGDDSSSYWQSLASRSSGSSQIAANLWQLSLRIEKEVSNGDNSTLTLDQFEGSDAPFVLEKQKPSLPSLPSLTSTDRYLLHSLLIHGQMTRPHAALSLGEPEGLIRSSIQALMREGVLQQTEDTVSIKAAYYGKLKTELTNNSFFVGGD